MVRYAFISRPLARLNLYRYSTGSNLNTYSALIQNFYTQETAPHQAIHLALNTGIEEGQNAGVKAYIRLVFSRTPQSHLLIFSVQLPGGCLAKARKLCLYSNTMRLEILGRGT